MSTPEIAERRPAVLDLEPGIYWWCACGKSKEQPFCDGSHKGSEFSPVAFEINEPTRIALCQCKHSANGYKCDGTHKNLPL